MTEQFPEYPKICLANWTFQRVIAGNKKEAFTKTAVVTKKMDMQYLERDALTISNAIGDAYSEDLKRIVINPATGLPKVLNIYFSKEISQSNKSVEHWKKFINDNKRNFLNTKAELIGERPEKCPVWTSFFTQESAKPYFKELRKFVDVARKATNVYPEPQDVFRAFKLCHYNETRIVIFGQDPYHTKGVADGLAFSSKGINIPPSLNNIFKEIKRSVNINNTCPDLSSWASQGILLLNTSLTVAEGVAGSHKAIGWDQYIKAVINKLNDKKKVLYLLWGAVAQNLEPLINKNHRILKAGHPSPLNTKNDFLGCGHFRIVNEILYNNTINWNTYVKK